MDPIAAINLGIIGTNALLELINHIRATSGLTDAELQAMFEAHGEATSAAIKGYLDNLPK